MLAAEWSTYVINKRLTLAEFIEFEMKRREMGTREFARFLGVSPSTISKHTNEEKVITPSVEFLVALADRTETNLESILAIAFPAVAERTALSPRAAILAQNLDHLPEALQDMLLTFVVSQKRFGKID